MPITFSTAVKTESYLRLLISGPSGFGKTWTSLAIATELVELHRKYKFYTGAGVAVLDTENGSANKYADRFADKNGKALYDTASLLPPYTPERYVDGINQAAKAGYLVLIIDSLTHAWTGRGGVLEAVNNIAASNKANSFTAWKSGTPMHNVLFDNVQGAPMHIIATVRSKEDHIITPDRTVKKVGLAPIQRNGIEYEFDVHLQMDEGHAARVMKTRASALDERPVYNLPGADVAEILYTWLQGEPMLAPPEDEQEEEQIVGAWQLWESPQDALAWASDSGLLPPDDDPRQCLQYIVSISAEKKLTSGNRKEVFRNYHNAVQARAEAARLAPGLPADWVALALARKKE